MELYHVASPDEKRLRALADINHIPLGGTMELLPLCNMDCRMCYVRMSREEMERQGRMLKADQWLDIVDQGISEGLLFLLLTGGEPLLYPEFEYIYQGLSNRGIITCVNTNGTLIDDDIARMFKGYGCRRVNVTLYGKDDETYHKLCGNPNGFTQVMHGMECLKKYGVDFRINCSVTPYNAGQLKELHAVAQRLNVPFVAATYMFPAERRGKSGQDQSRLTPYEAGRATLECFKLRYSEEIFDKSVGESLASLEGPKRLAGAETGATCHAGSSGFWMNWKGELMPCGIFDHLKISMLEHSFKECWDYIVTETGRLRRCTDCMKCDKQNACSVCLASCYTETGRTDGRPDYLCEMTQSMIDGLWEYVNEQVR